MTYAQLAEKIRVMSDEQLNSDITVYVSGVDEFYSAVYYYPFSVSCDDTYVLDIGHPYLVI